MIISTIVGMGNNNEIGRGNDIPWHLPADLKYFKRVTSGHTIIMGRKCFESIGRPLPNRTNIIITRNPEYEPEGCLIAHSLKSALAIASYHEQEEVFIIGGGEIYSEGLALSNRLYITNIDIDIDDADVFFPVIDDTDWEMLREEAHQKDEKNPHDYVFKIFERVNVNATSHPNYNPAKQSSN